MSSTADDTPTTSPPSIPSFILAYLLIGLAWGFTTPFIRRAARLHSPPAHPILSSPKVERSWIRKKVLGMVFGVVDLLVDWRYAVPLVLNLTGSVWFFLILGSAELSLTVPITNSLAFLFTVLGEWVAEKKVIGRDTWIGMVLSLCGIGLCVQSKTG